MLPVDERSNLMPNGGGFDVIEVEEPKAVQSCAQKAHKCCSKMWTCKNVASGARYCGFFIMGMGAKDLINSIVARTLYNTTNSYIMLGAVMTIIGQVFRPDTKED